MSHLEDALVWQLKVAGVPTPERQFRFHPTRRWLFDLCWPDLRLAVEVDGGVFVHGGHNRGRQIHRDYEKHNEAVLGGWTVLRVATDQVESGEALGWIERAIEARRAA